MTKLFDLLSVGGLLPLYTPKQGPDGNYVCNCRKGAQCRSAGKHPLSRLVPAGVLSATRNTQKYLDWARQNDGGNWGLATGKTVWVTKDTPLRFTQLRRVFDAATPMVVSEDMPEGAQRIGWLGLLDVDPRNGGDESLSALEKAHGRLPTTWTTITGGLGQHYWYLFPFVPSTGVLGVGLDLKGAGGIVALPGSMHRSGRRYEWEADAGPDDVELVYAPEWLQELVREFGRDTPKVTKMPEVASLLMRAFSKRGWLGARLAGGGYCVRCPWFEEHSDGRGDGKDSSTAVLPPSTDTRSGAFSCQHSHCKQAGRARKGVREVLTALSLHESQLLELEAEFPECTALLHGDGLLPVKRHKAAPSTPALEDAAAAAEEIQLDPGRPPACRVVLPWHAEMVWKARNKRGQQFLEKFSTNIVTILMRDPFFRLPDGRLRIQRNHTTQNVVVQGRPPVTPSDPDNTGVYLLDSVTVQWATRYFEQGYSLTLSEKTVASAMMTVAEREEVRPLEQWLRSLRWDGVPRLDTWLTTCFGVADTPYSRRVGRWWLISAVARAFKPGCKADHVLILEGGQGKGKSTSIQILAGAADKGMVGMPEGTKLFMDSPLDMGTKDSFQTIRGKWIVELAEMTSVKKGDVDKQKSFLSALVDTYRDSYGAVSRDWPRTCVMAGTVNPDGLGYLRDPTGARRFWPVECTEIDTAAVERDAVQLWAEATRAYLDGHAWYPQTEEDRRLLEPEQSQRLSITEDDDVWMPLVAKALTMSRRKKATLYDVFSLSFPEMDQHRISQFDTIRMGKVMHKLGWRKVRGAGTGRAYHYVAPADWAERSKDMLTPIPPSSRMLPFVPDDN